MFFATFRDFIVAYSGTKTFTIPNAQKNGLIDLFQYKKNAKL